MKIFVDIDGTLTEETEDYGYEIYRKRTPRYDIIQKINKLYDEGHEITIWTARFEKDRTITELWLAKNRVNYHELILGKPQFDLYICDKSINVEDI